MRISDWSSDVCSSDLLFCIKRSQLLLVDLSDTCSGKLIHYPEAIELGVAGDFAASDGALDRGVDDFQSGNGICLRDYDGQWPLSPFWIWHRDHRRSEEHTSELQSLMRISYAVFCLQKNTTQ